MKKIALINFMHSDPLYMGLSSSEVSRDYPAKILKGVLDRKYDAGMVSLMGYFANFNEMKLLETATIHSTGKVLSTLLISKGSDLRKGAEIAVTKYTETTVYYANLISKSLNLDLKFHRTDYANAEDLLLDHDYALVIGDEALRVFNSKRRILLDIGYEYSLLYHLPPVFAVTVAGRDTDASEIIQSLDKGIINSPNYVNECISVNSKKLKIREDLLREYYSLIKYDFTDATRKSIGFAGSVPVKGLN